MEKNGENEWLSSFAMDWHDISIYNVIFQV